MFYTDRMSTSKSLRKIVEIRHFHITHPTLVTSGYYSRPKRKRNKCFS